MTAYKYQPPDKLQELLQEVNGLQTTLHTSDEAEYAYLDAGVFSGICIEVENPTGGDALYIDLAGDFTLSFGDWQASYEAAPEEYALMLADLRNLLADRLYIVNVYCKEEWICSLTMEGTDIRTDAVVKEVREFLHTADCDEFIRLIRDKGAGIRCCFWTKGKKNIRLRPGEFGKN